MKHIYTLILLVIVGLSANAQGWTTKSYHNVKYSFPNNWSEAEYLKANNNTSYGAQYLDLGKIAQFSVIETPNGTGMTDAHSITDEDMRTVIQNLFSPNSYFQKIANKKIEKVNAKYAKVSVTGSNGKNLSSVNYIIFYKGKMIIIQGIYTTNQEKEFLPTLEKIIREVEVL